MSAALSHSMNTINVKPKARQGKARQGKARMSPLYLRHRHHDSGGEGRSIRRTGRRTSWDIIAQEPLILNPSSALSCQCALLDPWTQSWNLIRNGFNLKLIWMRSSRTLQTPEALVLLPVVFDTAALELAANQIDERTVGDLAATLRQTLLSGE